MSGSPRNILLPPPLRIISVLRNLLQSTERHAALDESHRSLVHRYEAVMRRFLGAVDDKNESGRALVAAELAERDAVLGEMKDYMAERRASMAATMDTTGMCKTAVDMDLRKRGGVLGKEEWEECMELVERVESKIQQMARMSTADCRLLTELAKQLRGRGGTGEIFSMAGDVTTRRDMGIEMDKWDWKSEDGDFDEFEDGDELWEAVDDEDEEAP